MEILQKLYLELANVVPRECLSSREIQLQRTIDRYGVALMMIAEGCAEPIKVAANALSGNEHLSEQYRTYLRERGAP